MYKVFIDGKEGTTGLKISERFQNRSDIQILNISDELRKNTEERLKKIKESDITFLCLPDVASKEIAELAHDIDSKIIDASTAFRCDDNWAYGLPELSDDYCNKIKSYKRIANPGCHATGAISIINPLIKNDVISKDYPLTITSLTGYSGGGKSMIADYDSPHDKELDAPRLYGLSQKHKHLPEIIKHGLLTKSPIFLPIVAPYYAGMLVTIGIVNEKNNLKLKDIYEIFIEQYKYSTFIKVVELGSEPSMLGSNTLAEKDYLKLFIAGNDERFTISAQFDNLGKGASGSAIQCMNIALGIDEKKGLYF
ncbi:N-acetyl-gamma-glutamyl-phosphate reductase [Fusobacterium sp. PH5-44]|uniref:N-acetyl-gamma-glutamyl-phosphate reductase n=1 Tax=unclassified Fusobacterium TaxID=2648384 RepID=UPI003D202A0A